MCGIAGIISLNGSEVHQAGLKKMTDAIAHRGPDSEGCWINPEKSIGFGHRRLSILDLTEKGKQPMTYSHTTITLNGEIYNYIELKNSLLLKGHVFRTDTDTEVVLAAYLEYGEECVHYFDGMFAFAIWDEVKKKLFCARDRFGEKPFFYFKNESKFIFASEMKAIFTCNIAKNPSSKMIYNYLAYDIVESPDNKHETFYTDINQLPPAHSLSLSLDGELILKRYWDIDPNKQTSLSKHDSLEYFKELFNTSIKRRMRSDVEVGTSFSGGLDSSAIVASISHLFPNNSLNTFTARFKDDNYDEGKYIDYVKQKFNFNSHYTWPTSELLINELDKVFYHQEEPFGSTSILAQWSVMKKAKEHNITVLLDGQGADETLAGYYKYFLPFLHDLYKKDRTAFKKQLYFIENELGLKNYLPKSFYLDNKFPNARQKIGNLIRPYRTNNITKDLNKEFLNYHIHTPSPFKLFTDLNSSLYFDTFKYGLGKLLRFSDRNAMAFSREVRLPYLSHELVEFAFSLPSNYRMQNGWSKKILRDSMNDLLPYEISWRKDKKGFQAPKDWLLNKDVVDLKNESIKKLKKEKIISSGDDSKTWQYIMANKLLENA